MLSACFFERDLIITNGGDEGCLAAGYPPQRRLRQRLCCHSESMSFFHGWTWVTSCSIAGNIPHSRRSLSMNSGNLFVPLVERPHPSGGRYGELSSTFGMKRYAGGFQIKGARG